MMKLNYRGWRSIKFINLFVFLVKELLRSNKVKYDGKKDNNILTK